MSACVWCMLRIWVCVFACKQASVMTGSAVQARLKWAHCRLISIPICLLTSGKPWKLSWCISLVLDGPVCSALTQPVKTQLTHVTQIRTDSVEYNSDLASFLNLALRRLCRASNPGFKMGRLLQTSLIWGHSWDSQPPIAVVKSPLTRPPERPSPCLCGDCGTERSARAGTECQGKGVSGAPRGCGLHSYVGDLMLKGCQLGFCHGWCVLKTCRLLCSRAGLSEAVKCSHFSLLVPCFFWWCVDRSITSSLSHGGKSMPVSLPCHWFPGYLAKDRSEPVVVSACLMEKELDNDSI